MSDQLLTVKQAAARMKRSPAWVHYLIKNKRLEAFKPGMEYLIKQSDVDAFKHRPRGKPSTVASSETTTKRVATKRVARRRTSTTARNA